MSNFTVTQFVSGDHKISANTPGGSPAIANQVVVHAIETAKTDSNYCMVSFLSNARRIIVNSGFIRAEFRAARIHRYRNGTDCAYCVHKSALVSWW